jgi:hypothetical protein
VDSVDERRGTMARGIPGRNGSVMDALAGCTIRDVKSSFNASRLRMQRAVLPQSRSDPVKKLKLEDLTVTSFDTTPNEPQTRGTVDGHAKPTQAFITCACEPTDPNRDCTYGCSRESVCPDNCVLYSDVEC